MYRLLTIVYTIIKFPSTRVRVLKKIMATPVEEKRRKNNMMIRTNEQQQVTYLYTVVA